jgi:PAS domain S-box-containing protein
MEEDFSVSHSHDYHKQLKDRTCMLNIEKMPDIVMVLSLNGTVHHVNSLFTEVLGYTAQEALGKRYAELVHPDDVALIPALLNNLETAAVATNSIHCLQKRDGTTCFVSWSCRKTGNNERILCFGRRVPEAAETTLLQVSKERLLQVVIDNAFDFLALTDEKGIWLHVSDTFCNYFGYRRSDLVNKYCFDFMHPDDLPNLLAQFQVLLEGQKKIQVAPYRFRSATGAWLWMEAIVTNQLDNPEFRCIVVSGRDISERITAERRAKELQLLEALMEGEEKERSRIARDLHDEISGMMAAAQMHFGTLPEKLSGVKANRDYSQGMHLLETAALHIRRTSHNLMPEILLENGLDEALNRYCNSISSDGLRFDYISIGSISRYAPGFELALYRIAQELINNIIRHAQASRALVQLSHETGLLSLTIEDNGNGFLQTGEPKGTGLMSVRKRITAMGGTIQMQSSPGNGTSVYIEFQQ